MIKNSVKELVRRDDVKYVVGYKPGTYGWRVSPAFVRTPEEADNLIFSPLCINNLATYAVLENRSPLPEKKSERSKKIGLIVKGCDSRAVTLLLQENAISRADVIVIGVPCRGVIDPEKMRRKFGEVLQWVTIEEADETYAVSVNGTVTTVPKEELVADHCNVCQVQTPMNYDILLGEPIESATDSEYPAVSDLEMKSEEERWKYWQPQFERCVRCYACRNICPVCNCEKCMADTFQPNWIRSSVNISENTAYHVMRAFHMAGRCISCGMCEKACPVNIPLNTLYKKVEQDVSELFEYTAGMDPNVEPLLSVYNTDDSDEGIL